MTTIKEIVAERQARERAARRDMFVAAALTGMLASESENWHYEHKGEVVRRAVAVADMTLERIDQAQYP